MKTTLLYKESKGNIFWGILISADIFLSMANIPDIFWIWPIYCMFLGVNI